MLINRKCVVSYREVDRGVARKSRVRERLLFLIMADGAAQNPGNKSLSLFALCAQPLRQRNNLAALFSEDLRQIVCSFVLHQKCNSLAFYSSAKFFLLICSRAQNPNTHSQFPPVAGIVKRFLLLFIMNFEAERLNSPL